MANSHMRNLVCIAVLAACLLTTAVAFAHQVSVSGHLNRDGTLVQYSTWRTHTLAGPISMNLTNNTATHTRLGLRDRTGVQFTHTLQWNSVPNSMNFSQLSNGSIIIPAGTRFAINGRMGATTWPWDNFWAGTLSHN